MITRLPLLLLLASLLFAIPAHATATGGVAAASGEATKTEDSSAAAPTPAAAPEDALGRTTPRKMVAGFLDALAAEDFDKAGQYLDLSKVPNAKRKADAVKIAQNLQVLLDKGGWFYPSTMINDSVDGKKDEEGIAEDVERIGALRGNGKNVDILAQHIKNTDGTMIWLIAGETIVQLPELMTVGADNTPLINKILPSSLIENKWDGAPIGHWLAMIALMVLAYISAWFIILSLFAFVKKLWSKKCTVSGIHFLDAVRLPVSLYTAVWIFAYSGLFIGVSLIVRQAFSQLNVVVAWTAIALLAWRLIDIFADAAQKKIIASNRFFGISSILFFVRRMIKIIFGVIIFIIILDNLGVDVTAGLAALGIGGIALALGAQKTLENFIGSLSIIIDQPLHIGDYCKIGNVSGTVEDIGMRSTRIRTNERTLVTIPNGDLSTQMIENYARRSRFLMHKKFTLRYDTTPEQIRLLLKKIEEILFAHESVTEEGMPVRLLGPVDNGFTMEIFCYINVQDVTQYLKAQQDLLLQIIGFMSESHTYFAIPSQTFLPAVDQTGNRPLDVEKPA